MSVVLSEHLPLLTSAPDGINRLRGLILELAVRGKLVGQDPNEEPASRLMIRIKEERIRLDAVATRKKNNTPSTQFNDTPRFDLPHGWERASLGDVVEIVRGITFPSNEKSNSPEPGRVLCLRTSNVQEKIEWDDVLYIRSEFISRTDQYIIENDIVMSMANSRELVGKVALVDGPLTEQVTFGGFLGVLRPLLISPKFLMAFLRAPTVRASLIDSASQTTNIANISLGKLRPLEFFIPPLAEQQRIIAKVDELMTLCDQLEAEQADATSAHARLVETLLGTLTQSTDATDLSANWQRVAEHFDILITTEASIDVIKQTVLQLAVMGKLVRQDPKDEPACELVNRITQERSLLEMEKGRKRIKPLLNVGKDEIPFNAPAGWEWLKFGTVVDLINGDRSRNYPNREEYVPSGVAWINTGHIQLDGTLTTENMHFITREKFDSLRSGKIEPDDLVYCLRGATFGKTAFVTPYSEGAIASSLVIVRAHLPALKSYLYVYLTSPLGRSQIFRFDNGSAQPNLSANSVTLYAFPLPPLAEQQRIIAKVDELMAFCDNLKADFAIARQREATLADALIDSALEVA